MRRLRDLQSVELHLGTRRLPGHVLAVEGDTAVLALPLPAGPSIPCRLVFTADGGLVALTGLVGAGPIPGTARFRVADAAHVPQPRASSRLAITLEATVRPATGPEAAVPCRVLDVSAGGARLRGWAAAPGTAVTVDVALPPEGRILTVHAHVARSLPDGVGVRFDDGQDVGEAISRLVLAYRATVVSGARRPRRTG